MEEDSANYLRRFKLAGAIIVVLLLVTSTQISLFVFFVAAPGIAIDFVISFVDWILDNPVEGMLLMLCVYIIGTTLMLPASIFAMATAFLCCQLLGPAAGFFLGVLLIFLASSTGAFLAFMLARYLLKDTVKGCITPSCVKISALYMVIEENGLKVVLLCRLSPVIPYNLLNYALGASEVTVKDFLVGGFGMLPMICLYTYIAMSVQNIADGLNNGSDGQWYWYVMAAGAVLLVATVVYITCLAKKKLGQMMEEVRQRNDARGRR